MHFLSLLLSWGKFDEGRALSKATDPMRQEIVDASFTQPTTAPATFQDLEFDDPKQAFQVQSPTVTP